MEKKYQVFVSSTYKDLVKEREEVMQALLEMDCIPVGMELFPAADDEQWTLIKGLISDCDYYVLIVGGRYGSVHPESGRSYTQMEYEYAVKQNIPTISFLPKNPDDIPTGKTDKTDSGSDNLKKFKNLVQTKMCQFWTDPNDLGSKVSRSLLKLIKSKPRPGWVKYTNTTSEDAITEMSRLSATNEKLRKENERLKRRLEKIDQKVEFPLDVFYKTKNLLDGLSKIEMVYDSEDFAYSLSGITVYNRSDDILNFHDIKVELLITGSQPGLEMNSNTIRPDGFAHFSYKSISDKLFSHAFKDIHFNKIKPIPVPLSAELNATIRVYSRTGNRDFKIVLFSKSQRPQERYFVY